MTDKSTRSQISPQPDPGAGDEPSRPWRTEGVPKEQPPKRRPNWVMLTVWLLGYVVFFGLLTVQDRMSGPAAVPYTEFKAQVANKNVAEVFARGSTIEGALKKEAPLPGQAAAKGEEARKYQKFTTERPTFADDDLLTELTAIGATVRATPLVQQRGVLTNLLVSIAPFLLLVAFYVWMFKRQKAAMGGGLFGGGQRKPVNPESVRATFEDVAGIDEVEAEINEVVDFLRNPEKYRKLGARARTGSSNRQLADAVKKLAPQEFSFYDVRIDDLPLYNQDDDAHPADPVKRLKREITDATGVMFVTPEYNRSIPGVLKNAIDHASRPYGQSVWARKPVGVIGASVGAPGTSMAQQHLRNLLAYLDMPTLGQPEVFIHVKDGFFDGNGNIASADTKQFLQTWMDHYTAWIKALAPR